MRRALLAWDCGTGRGHLSKLKWIAEALEDRFEFDAALCLMQHADEIRPLCRSVFQAAFLNYDRSDRIASGDVPTSTWGEYLGDLGFRDQEFLSRQITWWQKVIRARRISLVISDFAPCALLAARGLGVPAVAAGIGYTVPPPDTEEFPVFIPEYVERIHDEAQMTACVNRAAMPLGVPELRRLSDIYACEAQLVATIPLLDPYSGSRHDPLIPPRVEVGAHEFDDRDEIFVYFSTTEVSNPAIIEALADLGVPVRIFAPALEAEAAGRLESAGVIVERKPVAPGAICRKSRLMVNSAQHGTLCLGLAAGIPSVVLPQQLEQQYNALAGAKRGTVRQVAKNEQTPERLRSIILECYHDRAMQKTARELASELLPFFFRSPRRMIRRKIGALF
jgi:UDP:flavonoid glycosyltransferase YjiC (YdhE family)